MRTHPTPLDTPDPLSHGAAIDWLRSVAEAERRGIEGLGRRARALERLVAIGPEIATLDLDSALDRILGAVQELSATRRAALLLREPDGRLTCERAIGRSAAERAAGDFAYSRSVVEEALASGRPVAVEDVAASPHRDRGSVAALGLRALVAVPLRSPRGAAGAERHTGPPDPAQMLGVIYLDTDAAEPQGPTRFDPSLLAAFAAQAATAIDNARTHRRLEEECQALGRALGAAMRCDQIVYRSAAMDRVCRALRQVAEADVTVLIQGETGTGKELVARSIHTHSRRRTGRFLAQNVGALPDGLLESELFGHRRGAFSGAVEHRAGLFEAAAGGTVFLDEIGDASPALQIRLLRLLETKSFRRLGESVDRATDVRVIAATHRDLEEEVRAGRFRSDLYYRLSAFPIRVPPLRDRREDIGVLVPHFVARANEELNRRVEVIPPAVLADLAARPWPGNVRELANTVQRLVLLSPGNRLVPLETQGEKQAEASPSHESDSPIRPLAEVEREHLARALATTGGNLSRAAQLLGLKRGTLRWRLRKHGLG